jgi:cobalamin synthase
MKFVMTCLQNRNPWARLASLMAEGREPRRLAWPAAVLVIGVLSAMLWGLLWVVVTVITG